MYHLSIVATSFKTSISRFVWIMQYSNCTLWLKNNGIFKSPNLFKIYICYHMACICENRQHIFSVFKLFNSCDDTLQTLSVQVKDKRHSDWLNSIKSVPWCKISLCYIEVSIILTCATHLSVIIKHKNSKKLFNYEFSNFTLQSLDSIQTALINYCKHM